MSIEPKLAACAAAVALLTSAHTAHATATATATISAVSWTLIDLDLTDGITPALTFTSPSSQSSAYPVNANGINQSVSGANQNTTASVSNVFGSAAASTSASGGQSTVTLKGSAVAGTSVSESAYAYPLNASFSLTPNTLLSITASFSASATTTVGYLSGNSEYAQGYGYLTASLNSSNNTNSGNQAYRGAYASYAYNSSTQTYSPTTTSTSGTLELLLANRTAVATTGYFNAYAYSYASSSIATPVPENHTLSLMSMGLVGLAVGVRRLRGSRRA